MKIAGAIEEEREELVMFPADVAKLERWPLRFFDERFEAEEGGAEAVRGTDDRWYAVERGHLFPFRAAVTVMDEWDRVLVGLRPTPMGGRLALPGDDVFVRNHQWLFEAAAEAILDVDWPFGRRDRDLLCRGLTGFLSQQPLPVTFDHDPVTRTVTFCLPFILTGVTRRQKRRCVRASGWVGRRLVWVPSMALIKATRGDLAEIEAVFNKRGMTVSEGFPPYLVLPLQRQLGL